MDFVESGVDPFSISCGGCGESLNRCAHCGGAHRFDGGSGEKKPVLVLTAEEVLDCRQILQFNGSVRIDPSPVIKDDRGVAGNGGTATLPGNRAERDRQRRRDDSRRLITAPDVGVRKHGKQHHGTIELWAVLEIVTVYSRQLFRLAVKVSAFQKFWRGYAEVVPPAELGWKFAEGIGIREEPPLRIDVKAVEKFSRLHGRDRQWASLGRRLRGTPAVADRGDNCHPSPNRGRKSSR